jgi:hypothetical protein
MTFLKKLIRIIVGLLLGMTILAGEEPQIITTFTNKSFSNIQPHKPEFSAQTTNKQAIYLVGQQSLSNSLANKQPPTNLAKQQRETIIPVKYKQPQININLVGQQPLTITNLAKKPSPLITNLPRKQPQTVAQRTDKQPQTRLVNTPLAIANNSPLTISRLTDKQSQNPINVVRREAQKPLNTSDKKAKTSAKNEKKKQSGVLKSLILDSSYKRQLKLFPNKRIKEIKSILEKIPKNVINQLLNLPKIINKDEINKSPYVIAFQRENTTAGKGARIYVRAILKPKSLLYSVYRKGEPYYNSKTKALLGYETIDIANTRLQQIGDPATLIITHSTQEVRVGDRLLETPKKKSAFKFNLQIPKINIEGNIISVLEAVYGIGKYNIVVIDKGRVDGLKVGYILDIYQRGRVIADRVNENSDEEMVQLPDEFSGTLMVLSCFKRVSYALIMKSMQVIHTLDKVKTPKYTDYE